MSTLEAGINRDDLRYFHEMSPDEQEAEWKTAQDYLNNEAERVKSFTLYPNLESVDAGLKFGDLQLVNVDPESFGIVSPIRQRNHLPKEENQGSLPILHRYSAGVLYELARDVKAAGNGDNEFAYTIDRNGIADWRISVTSLLRTTVYQKNDRS